MSKKIEQIVQERDRVEKKLIAARNKEKLALLPF